MIPTTNIPVPGCIVGGRWPASILRCRSRSRRTPGADDPAYPSRIPDTRAAASRAAIHFTWPGAAPRLDPDSPGALNLELERNRARLGEGIYRTSAPPAANPTAWESRDGSSLAGSRWVVRTSGLRHPHFSCTVSMAHFRSHGQGGTSTCLHRASRRASMTKAARGAHVHSQRLGQPIPPRWIRNKSPVRRATYNRVSPLAGGGIDRGGSTAPAVGTVLRPDSDGVLTLPARRDLLARGRCTVSPRPPWPRGVKPRMPPNGSSRFPSNRRSRSGCSSAARSHVDGNRFVLQTGTGRVTFVVGTGELRPFLGRSTRDAHAFKGTHRLLLHPACQTWARRDSRIAVGSVPTVTVLRERQVGWWRLPRNGPPIISAAHGSQLLSTSGHPASGGDRVCGIDPRHLRDPRQDRSPHVHQRTSPTNAACFPRTWQRRMS